ncbi:MAG: DUF5615 family PIN-like protein [Pseudonocardiaceae bacterium]
MVRLLLDEMYPPTLADALRDKGHGVIAVAASAELAGSDDATVLDVATGDGRCLVTETYGTSRCWCATPAMPAFCSFTPGDGRGPGRACTRSRMPLHNAVSEGHLPGPGDIRWLT